MIILRSQLHLQLQSKHHLPSKPIKLSTSSHIFSIYSTWNFTHVKAWRLVDNLSMATAAPLAWWVKQRLLLPADKGSRQLSILRQRRRVKWMWHKEALLSMANCCSAGLMGTGRKRLLFPADTGGRELSIMNIYMPKFSSPWMPLSISIVHFTVILICMYVCVCLMIIFLPHTLITGEGTELGIYT